ncbi:MAG: wax ester/triacylglycerol synthase family O-acyltransferase [Myxococcota bacterium]
MARYGYDRLSAQDASFLWIESESSPMHIGSVCVYEAGPLRNGDGGVDIDRQRRAVEAVLHWIPRYRQKIAWTPLEGWPVWVDDRHFALGYHIRHLSLPRPGTVAQLKEIVSRILARPLDRARPLGEMWVIEGLENGEQFAVVSKIHHCMVDGAAGADLTQILMSTSAKHEIEEPLPYLPRPAPGPFELLTGSLRDRFELGLDALRRAGDGSDDWASLGREIEHRARALVDLAGFALKPASETPLNGDLGPHRLFEWSTMPLDVVLDLRRQLGCTVNDIVLATVTGAVRRYLFRRRLDPAKLDFRVAAPVSTRSEGDARGRGNHVSTWIVPLPLAEADPMKQLAAVRDRTAGLKRDGAASGADTLMKIAEWLPPAVVGAGAQLARGPANLIVTNVPGPQFPLYSAGAPLLGLYPVVPIIPGIGLGIALFSYDGRLCWGSNADDELVPDLPAFVADVNVAFENLHRAAVSEYLDRKTGVPIEESVAVPEPIEIERRRKRTKKNGKKRAKQAATGR